MEGTFHPSFKLSKRQISDGAASAAARNHETAKNALRGSGQAAANEGTRPSEVSIPQN
jgi:hypothetical protein